MARPKPTVLLEYIDKNFRNEQVLQAESIYTVLYDGVPINLKSFDCVTDYPSTKYKKTNFNSKAHCINLAKRLNRKFKTNKFTSVELLPSENIIYKADWFE